jgi:integrase
MRRRYQNGSLSKVDGSWIAQWWQDGHRRKKTLGKAARMTKAHAKDELAQIVAPINAREQGANSETTLELFMSGVYLPLYRRKWKASTVGTNENRQEVHIRRAFGERKLRSIQRVELQEFLEKKADAGLSYSTVAHLRWDLRQIFRLAVAEASLLKNPAETLFIPRNASQPVRRVMNFEEVKRCIEALEPRESVIVRLAVLGGMRPGEIFGLKCGQLGEICATVRQRVYRGKIDSPKTVHSIRDAALPAGLLADLKAWVCDLPNRNDDAWMFPSETLTTPLAKDNVWRRSIRPKLKALGLDWVDFHVLRRTSSSLMNDLGVEGKVVSDQLGHTLDVNQNVYTQTSLKRRRQAVDTLETALKAS